MNLSRRGAVAGILATAMMPCAVPAQDHLRTLTGAYNASGQDLSKSFSAAPGTVWPAASNSIATCSGPARPPRSKTPVVGWRGWQGCWRAAAR